MLSWLKKDFNSNPHRFTLECLAWLLSISGSILYALWVKEPDQVPLYCVWLTGTTLGAWCAYLRRSAPNCCNYIMLTIIDLCGLIRYLN
jgi:hypothetical protein